MPNPVIHWEIAAKDAAALQAFYRELFGWEIETGSMRNYGIVRSGGPNAIGGGIMQTEGQMPPYMTVYAQVDDVQASLEKAVALGGTQVVPPTEIPGMGRFAMFTDPEGNLFGVYKETK